MVCIAQRIFHIGAYQVTTSSNTMFIIMNLGGILRMNIRVTRLNSTYQTL